MQKNFNETNESDEKRQENNQEEEDEEICFLCNREECEGNAEDSVWLQWDNAISDTCLLYLTYCRIRSHRKDNNLFHRTTDIAKLCIAMLKNSFVVCFLLDKYWTTPK